MSAPAPRLYVPDNEEAPRLDPRALRHASPGPGRQQAPKSRGTTRPTPPRERKPGGRPPQGPGGSGKGGPGGPRKKGPSTGTASKASAPLALRLALLPIRLALVPLRLAGLVLGRITGGRPWLALVLALGCGVIFIHAATLKTNQLIEQRDVEISALERSTASLRNSVAELGSTDRVSRVGREAGMVFPDPEGIGYLDARKAQAAKAAKTFGPPSAAWQPAPNPSTQNGDALNPDGTVVDDGSVPDGAVAGTEGAAAVAPETATGTTGEAAAPGTGEATDPATPTETVTPPSTGAATTSESTGAPTAAETGTTGVPESGGATGGATP
ncbi:MAG: hypothetical protein WC558_12060 [Patulibacter sp.]